MTASLERSVASGSTANFSVPFPYLDKSHVKVSLDGVLLDPATDYTWPNAGEVQLTAGNPTVGTIVERRRVTPTETLTVFAPGNLDSGDLNVGVLQPLYVAQEGSDRADDIVDRSWFTSGFQPGGKITKGAPGRLAQFNADGDLDDSGVSSATLMEASEAAVSAAGVATVQAGTATSEAGTATTAKDDAVSAKDLAQQWAANPEDSVVSGGLYSALHYAAKAASSLAGIVNGMAGWIHGATLKATPADADEFGFWDSVSGSLRKFTLSNLKDVFKATPWLPDASGSQDTTTDFDTVVAAGNFGNPLRGTNPHGPGVNHYYSVQSLPINVASSVVQRAVPYQIAAQSISYRSRISGTWGAWRALAWLDQVLSLVGGTLTGPLTLPGNPSNALHAAPKQYVDGIAIGVGQTWTDVSGSRALSTTYQNTSTRPRAIFMTCTRTGGGGTVEFLTGASAGSLVVRGAVTVAADGYRVSFPNVIVPPGEYYRVNPGTTGFSIISWMEL